MNDSDNWYFSTTTTRPQRASTWQTTTYPWTLKDTTPIYPSAWTTYDWTTYDWSATPVEQEYEQLIEDALDNAFA